MLVSDRRRRDPRQRRPRLRAAPDHPPRHPPRLQAGPEDPVLPQDGGRSGRADGPGLSRAGRGAVARDRSAEGRGRALLRDHRERHVDPGRRAGRPEAQGWQDAGRRTRIQAARHLRLPAGPDAGRVPRAGNRRGRGRLRRGHEPPARAGARRRQVQDGRRPGVHRRQDRVPRLREAGTAAGQGHRAICGRRRGRRHAAGPDWRGSARQHPVLRRIRRPGR